MPTRTKASKSIKLIISLIKVTDLNNKYINNTIVTQLNNPKFNKIRDIPVNTSKVLNNFIISKKENGKY